MREFSSLIVFFILSENVSHKLSILPRIAPVGMIEFKIYWTHDLIREYNAPNSGRGIPSSSINTLDIEPHRRFEVVGLSCASISSYFIHFE